MAAPAAPECQVTNYAATANNNNNLEIVVYGTSGMSAVIVQRRQLPSGSWTQIINQAPNGVNSIYRDAPPLNYAYQYRAYVRNSGGTSAASNVATVLQRPSAPTDVKAIWNADGTATVSWNYTTPGSYTRELRLFRYGHEWQVWRGAAPNSYIDPSPDDGTDYQLIVAIYDGEMYGTLLGQEAESATAFLPQRRTALAPQITSYPEVIGVGTSARITWAINHPDGSPQTRAEVEYSNGDETHVLRIETEQSASIPLDNEGQWQIRVRTVGVNQFPGEWSLPVTVIVGTLPTVTLGADTPTLVESLPFDVPVSVTTGHGELVRVSATLDGVDLKTWVLGNLIHDWADVVPLADAQLTNGQSYTLAVAALDSDGFEASANWSFSVDWLEPPTAHATVEQSATGVTVHHSVPDVEPPAISTNVYRTYGGTEELLAEVLPGEDVTDPFPPLNTPLTYRVETVSATGSTSSIVCAGMVAYSGGCVIDWGDGYSRHLPLMLNYKESRSIEREGSTLRFPGVTDSNGVERPLWYAGPGIEGDPSLSGTIIGIDEEAELEECLAWRGPWHLRTNDGKSLWVRLTGGIEIDSSKVGFRGRYDVSLQAVILAHD